MSLAGVGARITRRLGDAKLCVCFGLWQSGLFCVSIPPGFVEVVIWLQICGVKCGALGQFFKIQTSLCICVVYS